MKERGMKKRATLWILAAAACLPMAACGGCGDKPSGSGSSGAASTSTAALSASAEHPVASASGSSSASRRNAMMVRAGGAVGAIFRAASQMELSEEQKTKIEGIAEAMRDADKAESADGGGGTRKEMKALHEEIIAGVKAGNINAAKLEPHYAVLEKEGKDRATRDLEGLGKLHDVLDADQRKKLGEQIKKQEEERNDRAKKAEAAQAAHDAGPRPSPQKRRYERYGKELDLDAEQKKKLDALIPNEDPKLVSTMREEAKKRTDATVDAFMKDAWDAKGIPGPDIKQVRRPMDEQVKFFNGLLPTLKPEQKDKLAQRLEKQEGGGPIGGGGPDLMHRGRPGMHPGGPGGPGEHGDDDKEKDKDDDHK